MLAMTRRAYRWLVPHTWHTPNWCSFNVSFPSVGNIVSRIVGWRQSEQIIGWLILSIYFRASNPLAIVIPRF